jgi:hypothetical protein
MSPNIMSVARRIGGFFALLLFFEGLFLIAWAAYGGFTPSTWKGWVALLVLGPPAFLAGDWVADRVVSRIDRRSGAPADAVVSGRRVLLALAVALVYCGLFVLVSWLLGITFPT